MWTLLPCKAYIIVSKNSLTILMKFCRWEKSLFRPLLTTFLPNTVFAWLRARCGCKLGIFSEVGVLAIIRFTAPLNDCRSERNGHYCTFALSLFNLLRRSQIIKRLLIGKKYDHAANLNSESVKELLNGGIQCWFADTARGKVCHFVFLTFSGGKFYEIFYDNCASHSTSNSEK